MGFAFWKYHGLGNDFVLVDNMKEGAHWSEEQVVRLCDRHRGIGADGLIYVEPSAQADFRMVIYNADGSRPEMCGNGIRCFARYVADRGMFSGHVMQVETDRGVLSCELADDADGSVRVDMGAPILRREEVPTTLGQGERCIEEQLEVEGVHYRGSAISMGNPHFVIFHAADEQALALAPKLERHEVFPRRVNVEFVQLQASGELDVVVYERGCGFTQACGTGACAVGVAAVLTERAPAGEELRVRLPGGVLGIEVPADLSTVWMRGEAVSLFRGEWKLPL